MDNSINSINSNLVSYSIENAKSQVKTDEFEKRLQKAYNEKDDKKLKEVCKNFEQIFLKMMFDQMRATVQKSNLVDNSMATDTFEEMFYDKITENVAEGPGVGLGDMLYKSLKKDIDNTYTTSVEKKDKTNEDVDKKE